MASTLEARVTQHDREIAAIRKLILQGMKMLVHNDAQIKALTASQRETDKMLKETDRMLQRLIRSLEQGGRNGHSKSEIR